MRNANAERVGKSAPFSYASFDSGADSKQKDCGSDRKMVCEKVSGVKSAGYGFGITSRNFIIESS